MNISENEYTPSFISQLQRTPDSTFHGTDLSGIQPEMDNKIENIAPKFKPMAKALYRVISIIMHSS